jgi:hypothetical protein
LEFEDLFFARKGLRRFWLKSAEPVDFHPMSLLWLSLGVIYRGDAMELPSHHPK